MATWGTLLLTLFIMDFKLSFGLKGDKNRIEYNALATTVQTQKTQVLQYFEILQDQIRRCFNQSDAFMGA